MRQFSLVLVLLLVTVSLRVFADDDLRVITFNSPPYSITNNQTSTGYATELVREVLKQLGSSAPIEVFPLLRGLYTAKTSPNILIYPVNRQDKNEHQFHWIGKISASQSYLFKHKSRKDINIATSSDAAKYSVGVVRGSTLTNELIALGITDIDDVNDGIQNVLKLGKSRIDLIASDELTLKHHVDNYNRSARTKLDIHDYVKVLPIPVNDNRMYLAMGKHTSLELVNDVITAFIRVNESGKLIEVAHHWTNPHEQAHVNIYKSLLSESGYKWVDYTFEGGAGGNLASVIEAREHSKFLPHAIQNYAGPQIKSWARQGLIMPLDGVAEEQQWATNLPKSIQHSIMFEGQFYAAPVNLQRVNWVWVNSKVFSRNGIAIPRTWDEFFNVAEKLTALGVTPIAMGDYAWQKGTLFELMALGLGGKDFYHKAFIALDADMFNSDKMKNILLTFKRVFQYTGNIPEGRGWVGATEMLIDGDAAIYFMGDWVKGALERANFPYGDDGYLCRPAFGTEGIFLSNVDVFVFPYSGYHHVPAQQALAQTIMDSKAQREFNLTKGSIPARTDVSTNTFDQCSRFSSQAAKEGHVIPSFNFLQIQPKQIHEPIIDIISGYVHSDTPVEVVLDRLYNVVNRYNNSQ